MTALRPTALALLLAGLACFRTSPPVTYHTLHALAGEVRPGPALAVEVRPVRLPEVLRRPQLVEATSRGLELTPGHCWGNALESDIQRVLVADLAQLLGSERVVPFPLGPRVDAGYRVEVEVLRCEGRPGGTLTLQATWMITAATGEKALALRHTTLEEPVGGLDTQALVAAHDRVLAALARQIAGGLRGL